MSENRECLFESEEEALENCWRNMITYESELYARIKSIRTEWEMMSKNDTSHSVGFYKAILELLSRFKKKIDQSILFDMPEHWGYSIDIDTDGIELSMEYIDRCTLDENGMPEYIADERYPLIRVEANQLTVEEYAAQYGVEVVTVRQWIRRGKLRTAHKEGTTWKISELTEMPGRGYKPAYYYWSEELKGLPEEFQFLNNYKSVDIKQDDTNKDLFIVNLWDKDGNPETRNMPVREKEKLEVYLISHAKILSSSLHIASYD